MNVDCWFIEQRNESKSANLHVWRGLLSGEVQPTVVRASDTLMWHGPVFIRMQTVQVDILRGRCEIKGRDGVRVNEIQRR